MYEYLQNIPFALIFITINLYVLNKVHFNSIKAKRLDVFKPYYTFNSVEIRVEITFLHFLDTKYTMQLDNTQSLSSSEVTHTCGEIDAFNLFLIETETVNELFGKMTTACEYPDCCLCVRAYACMWVMRLCLCALCYRYMVCVAVKSRLVCMWNW